MKRPLPTEENEEPPKRKNGPLKKFYKVHVPTNDGGVRIYDHGGEEELIQFVLNLEEDLGIKDCRFYNEGKIILLQELQKDVWELENVDIYINDTQFGFEKKESEHFIIIMFYSFEEVSDFEYLYLGGIRIFR